MNYSFIRQRVYRFRRFVGKGYAAFASMHKIVNIGHLCVLLTDKEMLKAGRTTAVCGMLLATPIMYADITPPDDGEQRDLQLQEVSVVAQQSSFQSESFRLVTNLNADQLVGLPIKTVSDLLKYIPGIDLRERGAGGVQADLTIRGGTGRQVKILLNGVDITDPQTDHYSMDIPIDPLLIERVEVLQGTNYALDAFSGAINIITKSENKQKPYRVTGEITGGEYGLVRPALAARISRPAYYINTSASYNRSSGYTDDSDYKMTNAFFQAGGKGLDFQVGAQHKDAGANSFYTVKYPNQYDQTRTLITSLGYAQHWGNWNLSANMYYRGHFDRFHTYRNNVDLEGNPAPSWYKGPNVTWTHTQGAHIEAAWHNEWSQTTFGVDVRDELIRSSSLGNHNRVNVRYFAEERVYWRTLSAALGASGIYNTQFGNDWSVGANLGYHPLTDLHFFLNFNRAIRIPTYTDLYYKQGNTQLADPNTRPEEALQIELSAQYKYKHLYTNASAYYRWGRNIIDWVKDPDPQVTLWRSTNHSKVDAAGMELAFGVQGYEWIKRAEINYAFADVRADAGQLLSLYALDYLRHKLALHLEHKIYKGFGATWCARFEQREGQYTSMSGTTESYKPVFLLDVALYWANDYLRVQVDGRNITNTRYVDIGGVVQPQHWVSGKIQFTL